MSEHRRKSSLKDCFNCFKPGDRRAREGDGSHLPARVVAHPVSSSRHHPQQVYPKFSEHGSYPLQNLQRHRSNSIPTISTLHTQDLHVDPHRQSYDTLRTYEPVSPQSPVYAEHRDRGDLHPHEGPEDSPIETRHASFQAAPLDPPQSPLSYSMDPTSGPFNMPDEYASDSRFPQRQGTIRLDQGVVRASTTKKRDVHRLSYLDSPTSPQSSTPPSSLLRPPSRDDNPLATLRETHTSDALPILIPDRTLSASHYRIPRKPIGRRR